MSTAIYYLNFLVKKYHEMCSVIKNTPAYTIHDIRKNKGVCQLIIKINGTGKTTPYFLTELFSDEELFNEFSVEDRRTIFRLDYEEKNKPLYNLSGIKFCENIQSIVFCLKNRISGKIEELNSDTISHETEIVNQCSALDAFRMGCSVGIEKSKNQSRLST